MAVDITVHSPQDPKGSQVPMLTLKSDGYYWFLHPLFSALAERTGRYIDLYGDATFRAHELAHLDRLLSEARALVAQQPEQWQVSCGTQTYPAEKEIMETVTREHFRALLDHFEQIVNTAKKSNGVIKCVGD